MTQQTITITFGDVAENHVGMQQIGQLAPEGFTVAELTSIRDAALKDGYNCELIDLNSYLPSEVRNTTAAAILIIRNGVNYVLGKNTAYTVQDLWTEKLNLTPDTKAFMYGRVVNKHARYNLCFSDIGQEPQYENGKGRVVAYNTIPVLNSIRQALAGVCGVKGSGLVAEGNYYYDVTKCGISFHGDSERRRVIALRLGASLPLHYQWFIRNKPIGDRVPLILDNGDLYVMSEKATGNDWKKSSILTLRHAAGCQKFLTIKTNTRNRRNNRNNGGNITELITPIVVPNIIVPNIIRPDIVTPNIIVPNIVTPNIIVPNIVTPDIITPDIIVPTTTAPAIITPTTTQHPKQATIVIPKKYRTKN